MLSGFSSDMSLVREFNHNNSTFSTLLDNNSKSDMVKQKLDLAEKECESLRQKLDLAEMECESLRQKLDLAEKECESLRQKLKILEKELESLKQEQQINDNQDQLMSRGQVEAENNLTTGEKRNRRLQFRNKLPQEIITGLYIKAKEHTPIEVELVDGTSGQVVNSGPEASAAGEIVLLCGYGEFNNSIISVWGKKNKPLLLGEFQFNLNEGIGTIGDIKVRHCQDWMKQREFMLGARVVDKFPGVQIIEATTEPFIIKDRRNGCYSKLKTLTLEDEVYRLKNICRKGKIYPLLQEEHIYTVKDFLHWLFKEPAKLNQMLGLKRKKFEETIKHAQKGMINDRLCCYSDLDGKMMVAFDFVRQVLGVVEGGQYYHFQDLSDENKVNAQKLVIDALQHWEDVKFFNGKDSLLQKFPLAVGFEWSMISPVEECNTQNDDTSSKTVELSEAFKLWDTFLQSDEASSSEIHVTCEIDSKMEEYRRVLNVEPVRLSKSWVYVISVVVWIRVMFRKNTSTKRDCPQPETSTVSKKRRMC